MIFRQLNVAMISVEAFNVTEQVFPVMVVHPVQLTKLAPPFGVAVSVTVVPVLNTAPQDWAGQLIPAGELVTTPFPEPPRVTVRASTAPLPGQMGFVGSFTVTVA